MRYPLDQLAQAADREVKMRKRVYPNRVMTGRMTDGFATTQIELMEDIAELLSDLAGEERLL